MAKKRVHEIAKEAGLSSKDVLAKLQAAGLEVKAAASTVEEADALKALGVNGAAPKAAAKPTAPAKADAPEGRGAEGRGQGSRAEGRGAQGDGPEGSGAARRRRRRPLRPRRPPPRQQPLHRGAGAGASPLPADRARRARPGTASPPAAPGRVAAARAR